MATANRRNAEEQEFLERYRISDFERPSVAADTAVFSVIRSKQQGNIRKLENKELKILLVRRAQHPFKGCWALPGGFVRPGENVEETARRELQEETNVSDAFLRLSGIFGETGRDPRGWIISNTYLALIDGEQCSLRTDSDAWEAAWFTVEISSEEADSRLEEDRAAIVRRHHLTLTYDGAEGQGNLPQEKPTVLKALVREEMLYQGYHESSALYIEEEEGLAFDHARIIVHSVLHLRQMMEQDRLLAFDFLPELFTLTQLQNVYEKVLDQKLLSANFRRKIADLVQETELYTEGEGHRPAKLFRRNLEKRYLQ